MRKQRAAVWTIHSAERGKARRSLGRRDWVGKDVEGRRLAQETNDRITADNVAAIDAERLTESCYEQISGAGVGNLFQVELGRPIAVRAPR
jgi:hypothetical protein